MDVRFEGQSNVVRAPYDLVLRTLGKSYLKRKYIMESLS